MSQDVVITSMSPPAYRLMIAYQIEFRRYQNQWAPTGKAMDLRDFDHIFGTGKVRAQVQRAAAVSPSTEYEHRPRLSPTGRPAEIQVWEDIAEMVSEEEIQPEVFIRAQFIAPNAAEEIRKDAPTPVFIRANRSRAVRNVRAAAVTLYNQIEEDLRQGLRRFKSRVIQARAVTSDVPTDEQAWAIALNDSTTALSALFRYCWAVQLLLRKQVSDTECFRQTAQRFSVAAAIQYHYDRQFYNELWGKLLPPGYGAKATRIYNRFFNLEDTNRG